MDHRLKKNSQFKYIYKKGERVSTENFTLFFVKSRFDGYKIGYTVSKKLGKANKRNKLKRRLREIVRLNVFASHVNFVLMAREKAIDLPFEQLQKEILHLFDKFQKKLNADKSPQRVIQNSSQNCAQKFLQKKSQF